MSRETAIALALGALSGACLLSLASDSLGALILVYMSPLPLFLTGLMFGMPKAAAAMAAGSAVSAMYGLATVMPYVGLIAIPTAILIRQALLSRATPEGTVEWYPPGLLLIWLTAIAAAGFLLASLGARLGGVPGGLPGVFEPRLLAVLRHFGSHDLGGSPAELASRLASIMPGAIAAMWMLLSAANGILAQGLAVRLQRNIRPSPKIEAILLPRRLFYALGAAIIGAFLPGEVGYIGATLAVILAVPFFFQGLSVVHALARRSKMPGLVLGSFYVFLLLSGGQILAVLITAIGLIEQWAGFRRMMGGHGEEGR